MSIQNNATVIMCEDIASDVHCEVILKDDSLDILGAYITNLINYVHVQLTTLLCTCTTNYITN